MAATESEPKKITKEDIQAFCDACVWLFTIHAHFKELYEIDGESGEIRLRLLEHTAHWFFKDLQLILIGQIILQACRLTDPAETPVKGMIRDNLTTQFFVKYSDLPRPQQEELRNLAGRMEKFRKIVLPARNKRISHSDREAALSDLPMGAFKLGEFEEFQSNLQAFVNILYDYYEGGPFPLDLPSETDALIKALKQSTYFESLLEQGEMSEKYWKLSQDSEYSNA